MKEVLASYRPSIVFLMETKNKAKKLERVRRSIGGYMHRCYINPIGLLGGLAFWWNKKVDLQIIKASHNIIHTRCKSQDLVSE